MALTKYLQVPEMRLSGSGINSTVTSITVDKFEFANGDEVQTTDIGDKMYATLEPKTVRSEIISFTGFTRASDGKVTFTGVTRGLKPYDPYDQDTALRTSHAGGTKMVISNNPQVYDEIITFDNDEIVTGAFTFNGGVTIDADEIAVYDTEPTFTYGNHELVTWDKAKDYTDSVAIAGAPDASEIVKGIVEMATPAEGRLGTDIGSTGAYNFVRPSEIAKNIQNAVYSYKADAETSDTYAITLVPAITAYAEGQVFYFKANTVNTGACTLNVNGLGAKTIKKNADEDLEDGDIKAGAIVNVVFDGTNFQMINQQASMPTTALLEEAATFFNATSATGAQMEILTNGGDADSEHTHDLKSDVRNAWCQQSFISNANIDYGAYMCISDDGSKIYLLRKDRVSGDAKIYRYSQDASGCYYYDATSGIISTTEGTCSICFYNDKVYIFKTSNSASRFDADLTSEESLTITNSNEYSAAVVYNDVFYLFDRNDATGGTYTLSGTTFTRTGDFSITGAFIDSPEVTSIEVLGTKFIFGWVASSDFDKYDATDLGGLVFEKCDAGGGAATELDNDTEFHKFSFGLLPANGLTSDELLVVGLKTNEDLSAVYWNELIVKKVNKSTFGL